MERMPLISGVSVKSVPKSGTETRAQVETERTPAFTKKAPARNLHPSRHGIILNMLDSLGCLGAVEFLGLCVTTCLSVFIWAHRKCSIEEERTNDAHHTGESVASKP